MLFQQFRKKEGQMNDKDETKLNNWITTILIHQKIHGRGMLEANFFAFSMHMFIIFWKNILRVPRSF